MNRVKVWKMYYCIKCEQEVEECRKTDGSLCHIIDFIDRDYGPSWDVCDGPFATCPPPENPNLPEQEPDDKL